MSDTTTIPPPPPAFQCCICFCTEKPDPRADDTDDTLCKMKEVILECTHGFHGLCLNRWFVTCDVAPPTVPGRNCPTCRKLIERKRPSSSNDWQLPDATRRRAIELLENARSLLSQPEPGMRANVVSFHAAQRELQEENRRREEAQAQVLSDDDMPALGAIEFPLQLGAGDESADADADPDPDPGYPPQLGVDFERLLHEARSEWLDTADPQGIWTDLTTAIDRYCASPSIEYMYIIVQRVFQYREYTGAPAAYALHAYIHDVWARAHVAASSVHPTSPPATVQDGALDPIAEFERLSDAALREFANTHDVPLSAENAWDRVVRAKNVYRNSPTLANLRHVFECTHQYIGRMDEDTVPDAEAFYRYVQSMVAANWVPATPAVVPPAPSSEFEHLWQAMLGEYANNQNVPFSAENAWDRVGEAIHAYRSRPSIDNTERILECMHRYMHHMRDYTIPAAAAFYDYMRHVYRAPATPAPAPAAAIPDFVSPSCRETLTHFMHEVHIEWRGLVGVDSQYRDLCAAVVSARTLADMQQVVCAAAIFMCSIPFPQVLSPLHVSTAALQHYVLQVLSGSTTTDSMISAIYAVHRVYCTNTHTFDVRDAYRNLSGSIIPNRETVIAFYYAVTQHFTADHELRIAAARLRFLFA